MAVERIRASRTGRHNYTPVAAHGPTGAQTTNDPLIKSQMLYR